MMIYVVMVVVGEVVAVVMIIVIVELIKMVMIAILLKPFKPTFTSRSPDGHTRLTGAESGCVFAYTALTPAKAQNS